MELLIFSFIILFLILITQAVMQNDTIKKLKDEVDSVRYEHMGRIDNLQLDLLLTKKELETYKKAPTKLIPYPSSSSCKTSTYAPPLRVPSFPTTFTGIYKKVKPEIAPQPTKDTTLVDWMHNKEVE